MRLYQKAKRLGIWDPYDVDLSRDRADWLSLTDTQREVLLQLTSLFQAGEESVTLDLLPLLMVVAREGRLEEELFLTSFLWEEGKHTEFFRRVLDEVCVETGDLERFHGPSYRRLFYEELPASMAALVDDPSPAAQARGRDVHDDRRGRARGDGLLLVLRVAGAERPAARDCARAWRS